MQQLNVVTSSSVVRMSKMNIWQNSMPHIQKQIIFSNTGFEWFNCNMSKKSLASAEAPSQTQMHLRCSSNVFIETTETSKKVFDEKGGEI